MSAADTPGPGQPSLEAVLRAQLLTPTSSADGAPPPGAVGIGRDQRKRMEDWSRRVLQRSSAPRALREEVYGRFLFCCWQSLRRRGVLPERLEATLLASGRHTAVDAFRQRRRRRQVPLIEAADVPSVAGDDPVLQAEARELHERLHAAIGQLSPARRAVVVASLAGHSHAQIAAELGLGLGAVRQRLLQGRKALRELLA